MSGLAFGIGGLCKVSLDSGVNRGFEVGISAICRVSGAACLCLGHVSLSGSGALPLVLFLAATLASSRIRSFFPLLFRSAFLASFLSIESSCTFVGDPSFFPSCVLPFCVLSPFRFAVFGVVSLRLFCRSIFPFCFLVLLSFFLPCAFLSLRFACYGVVSFRFVRLSSLFIFSLHCFSLSLPISVVCLGGRRPIEGGRRRRQNRPAV